MKFNLYAKILKVFTLFFAIPVTIFILPKNVKAEVVTSSSNFGLNFTIDKSDVNATDEFELTITILNISEKAINNLEIRVPYYKTLKDVDVLLTSPSFNKVLSSGDYPAGLNDRSWLINSFEAGDTKSFKIRYKVVDSPKTPGGIISNFTLPLTWDDPAGLESGKEISLGYFRADVYFQNAYKSSHQGALPKLTAVSVPVSQVKLSEKYIFENSKTTNLKDINDTNAKSFPNFTLETQEVLLEWLAPVDLSGDNVVDKLSNLDNLMAVEWGKLEVEEQELTFLNKPIRATFKNLNFIYEPKIKLSTNIATLADAKAAWNKERRNIVINLDSLKDVYLYPNLILDQGEIETKEKRIQIKGKVSDPEADLSYQLDNASTAYKIVGADVKTGEFSFLVDDVSKVSEVEVLAKLKNGQSEGKVVLVKYTAEESVAPTPINSSTAIKNKSAGLNPIMTILIIAAVAILCILIGAIFYIINKRSRLKSKEKQIDLNELVAPETDVADQSKLNLRRTNDSINTSEYLNLGDFKAPETFDLRREKSLEIDQNKDSLVQNSDKETFNRTDTKIEDKNNIDKSSKTSKDSFLSKE